MITNRKLEVLRTIDSHIRVMGRAPTRKEIGKLVGLSVSGVSRIIDLVVESGYLDKIPNVAAELMLTEKGRAIIGQSPIYPPERHDPDNVVCRYRIQITNTKSTWHEIRTNGTCSCGVKQCFHLRQAEADLPDRIEELQMEYEDNAGYLAGELIERMEKFLNEHAERILTFGSGG